MRAFRPRLVVGQHVRTQGGKVEGMVDAAWPVENGTEALVRPCDEAQEVREPVHLFFPSKITADPYDNMEASIVS